MQQPTGAPAAQQQPLLLWRCPQCGFIFSPQPKIVRCPRCGENLRKCRYCKFADTVTWECTNSRIRFTFGDETGRFHIPEPDHFWACPENLPDLQPPVWSIALSNPLLRALTLGAAIAVLLLVVFRFAILPAIGPQEVPVSALVSAQAVLTRSQFTVGESIPILLIVTNSERVPLDPCIVVLRGELVEHSELRSQPSPLYPIQRTPKSARLTFPGIPSQQSLTAWIYLTPLGVQRRSYEVAIEIYCGGYRAIVNPRSVKVDIR
ncbi:MAG: hydrogenase maturation nickel metallochaperone HypA [Armatimonadetes bacterium]|nr:hydrogenase maturation nickel metallochaperone HypA [Armatimonadota bacterium]MDW8026821.1 hypothetical protein [Armatimonadota bacterium]